MKSIDITVEINVGLPLEKVFDFMAADDCLPKILIGTNLLPRVVRTADATGPWNIPGSTRKVYLLGGDTATEELTSFKHNKYFSYNVKDYTFALKYFAEFATGQWWFTSLNAGETNVKWTYSFHPFNSFGSIFSKMFGSLLWRNYMKTAMEAMKFQLEESKQYSKI